MIPLANLIAFVLVAIPIILVPGPSVLFVIGRSLSLGRIGGLLSVVGNAIGGLVAGMQERLGNAGYFAILGLAAIVMAGIFATQIKRLRVLMVGVH